MVGIDYLPAGPQVRSRLNDGLSHNGGLENSMYLKLSYDTPIRCSAIVGAHGLQAHQYHSTYEVSPERAELKRRLYSLYALRRTQRSYLRAAQRAAKRLLLASFREQCLYTVPRFFYRKVVELRSRPVYKLEGVYVYYRVTRKKLLWKKPYKRKVVWYTTIVLNRHRGLVRKKRRHEKVVTLYKRKWKIWTEIHKRKFGKKKVFVRTKIYKIARRIKTPLPPRIVFDKDRYLQYMRYEVSTYIANDPTVLSLASQIADIDKEITLVLVKLKEPLKFHDNRAFFYGTTTLLEATSKELIEKHRFTATFGSVNLPHVYGPASFPVPGVEKYSRVAGHQQFYYMKAVDDATGTILASGFPGDKDNPSSFFIRGFSDLSSSLPVDQEDLQHLYSSYSVSTFDINDPLLPAKTNSSMWEAANALANGDIGRSEPFVLTRSIAELKDTDQTISTMREALEWASAQGASSTASKRLSALEAKWAAGTAGNAKDLARLKSLTKGSLSLPRGTLVYAAGLYCCYKFALEPTVSDILHMCEEWHKAVFGLRSNLAKMLDDLDDPSIEKITLRKRYVPDLEPQDIKSPTLPPREERDLEFSFSGPDTTGDNTDTYDLSLGSILLKSVVRNRTTYVADGSTPFGCFESPSRIVVHYHEERAGLVYVHANVKELLPLVGEDIRNWRDILSSVIERTKFVQTIWELLPLSFILDWFATTGRTMRNLHNLVSSWYSGTYPIKDECWATQYVRKIHTKTLTSAMDVDHYGLVYKDPFTIYVCSSKEEYQAGHCSAWRHLYRNCGIRLRSLQYWPAALTSEHTFRTRAFGRGAYYAGDDVFGAISSLVPKPRVHLNLGKLASLTAVLSGILMGRKR